MKKVIFFIILVFLALSLVVVFYFKRDNFHLLNKNMETMKICFNEHCFLAQVAKTKEQRAKGLMFRENLADNEAMLFVFENIGLHSFWMKNCKIPLDIIWLDENYKVVAIKPNNQPCPVVGDCVSISPNAVTKYVLEIKAGLASQLGLDENSTFTIDNIQPLWYNYSERR